MTLDVSQKLKDALGAMVDGIIFHRWVIPVLVNKVLFTLLAFFLFLLAIRILK